LTDDAIGVVALGPATAGGEAANGDGDCDHGGHRRHLPHRADLPRPRPGGSVRAGLQRDRPGGAWETGAPPGAYDGPYWRAQWWARVPVSKRRGDLRHTHDGERRADDIRQESWTGDALPDAKLVRRKLTGVPKVEVVGRSKEKVEELLWDTITQVRADLARVSQK